MPLQRLGVEIDRPQVPRRIAPGLVGEVRRVRMPALAAATKIWRDMFRSPEEVYTKGLAFIREMWSKG